MNVPNSTASIEAKNKTFRPGMVTLRPPPCRDIDAGRCVTERLVALLIYTKVGETDLYEGGGVLEVILL